MPSTWFGHRDYRKKYQNDFDVTEKQFSLADDAGMFPGRDYRKMILIFLFIFALFFLNQ
jgi:hypothetical protein